MLGMSVTVVSLHCDSGLAAKETRSELWFCVGTDSSINSAISSALLSKVGPVYSANHSRFLKSLIQIWGLPNLGNSDVNFILSSPFDVDEGMKQENTLPPVLINFSSMWIWVRDKWEWLCLGLLEFFITVSYLSLLTI